MTRRHLSILVVSLIAMPAADANPFADYRWKHRILVLDFPKSARADFKAVEKQLAAEKRVLAARDLILFDVGELRTKVGEAISDATREAMRTRLGLDATSTEPTIFLLGKDGGVKSRQEGEFDLSRFYALIDTMPMRKREMRERGE